jgi:pimeloyl-ACP methyl ester carboxylesterase
MSWPVIILLVPLGGLGAFVLVTGLLARLVFSTGGPRGEPEPWLVGALGWLGWFLLEWLASAWVLVAIPFRRLSGRGRGAGSRESVPVALLPGYLENALTLRWLEARLARALGVPVRAFSPPGYFMGIDALTEDYQRQIHDWLRELGCRRVALVGHSMGGLVARALAERSADEVVEEAGPRLRVSAVVSLATPHQGSALSPLALGRNARQMRRGSGFLEALNTSQPPRATRYLGICSVHDNLVLPWSCGLSPRGENVILRHRGHLGLLLSAEVVRRIAAHLREAG